MRRLELGGGPINLATAASALPFPPVQVALVPSTWNDGILGAIPEFDIEIWADGTCNLTAGILYAGKLEVFVNADDVVIADASGDFFAPADPLVYADKDFTADAATEIFTAATHGLLTGDGPLQVSNSGGALPAGLSALTDYWVIKIDTNTFYLAVSLADALAGTHLFITTNGTGTQTISDTPSTMRLSAHGLETGDGPLRLTSDDTLPAGLTAGTDYWIIKTGTLSFQFAASFADAMAHTPVVVPISTDGTGTLTLSDTADSKRLHWFGLGPTADPIALDTNIGYLVRLDHHANTVAYGLVGTLSAATVSAAITGIADLG